MSVLLPGNQTPEPGRKELLRFFGLTETQLNEYRALPLAEAKWRLDHEHRVQQAWVERRRAFLVAECLQPRHNGNGQVQGQKSAATATGLEAIRSNSSTHNQPPRIRTRSTR